MANKIRYAAYPSAQVHGADDKSVNHVLWGDWVKILDDDFEDGQAGPVNVHVRGTDGWMHAADLQKERLLEIVFVDVGQGDGCLVVTPDDKHIVIDAGVSTNMYRFLKWRYAGFKRTWTFESAIVTHPDTDHYLGFQKLFEDRRVRFSTVYHNGLMEERTPRRPLGPTEKIDGVKYCTNLMAGLADLQAFLADTSRWKHPQREQWDKKYANLLNTAATSGRVGDIRMLSTAHSEDGHLPGYGQNKELSIRVLGPVVETDDGRRPLLRWFESDKAKTKNGHSVLLSLRYRDLRILLGGDLNAASENFLLEQYTGLESPPTVDSEQVLISAGRPHFGADIAKACHHGAADFTDAFLGTVGAAATVVSSGDDESHAHPRSDTLGAMGKLGRGARPLIFSTELARSTEERDPELARLKELIDELIAEKDEKKREKLRTQIDKQQDKVSERNVTVYGSINLRTDGRKAVMAYKLERERRSSAALYKWDIYRLERPGGGDLVYVRD